MPLDLAGVTPPAASDFLSTTRRARSSAPGPDDLPYLAWAAAGECGAVTIADVELDLRSGRPPPIWWNAAVWLFMPKQPASAAAPADASETRPLALKDTCNKVVGGT